MCSTAFVAQNLVLVDNFSCLKNDTSNVHF